MVTLTAIRESNSRIATALPPDLVGVFVGATSGIGETTVKQFAKSAHSPRVYFIGRSEEAAARIEKELASINPRGTYTFLKADASQLRDVDRVCRTIGARETAINVLFLSPGTLLMGTRTAEDQHLFATLTVYARLRFAVNLLSLLQRAEGLRRVVTVFAGTKEGAVQTQDLPAMEIGMRAARGHFSSMLTLALEVLAAKAPTVAFVHDYPGFVKSRVGRDLKGPGMAVMMGIARFAGLFLNVPLVEVGERHVYFLTSGRFPPLEGAATVCGVGLEKGRKVASGTTGRPGSGVYSIDFHGEAGGKKATDLLAKLRAEDVRDQVWRHIEETFAQVTGSAAIE